MFPSRHAEFLNFTLAMHTDVLSRILVQLVSECIHDSNQKRNLFQCCTDPDCLISFMSLAERVLLQMPEPEFQGPHNSKEHSCM